MTSLIEKLSFGEAGCVHVATGSPIPVGQYCAMQCVTDVTLPTITLAQAPLTATGAAPTVCTISGKVYPAGFVLYTPLVFAAAGGTLTGDAIFYNAL